MLTRERGIDAAIRKVGLMGERERKRECKHPIPAAPGRASDLRAFHQHSLKLLGGRAEG
jgi:hypothetical protein